MAAGKIHIPEVYEPDESLPQDLLALRRLTRALDSAVAIPGTRKRIGLDAGLGLIPGVGDVVSAGLSAWIIAGAIRHRVPLRVLGRMISNVGIDLLVGAIPFFGDIFDMFFAQNVANFDLLMKHRDRRRAPRTAAEASGAIFVMLLIVGGMVLITAILATMLIIWLAGLRNSG